VFYSVRDLELRKAQFDVSIEPGVIDFLDANLRQAGPLAAQGSVELVSHSEGDIQMRGKLRVRMESDCDRCLEPAQFDVENSLDILFKPSSETEDGEEAELGEDETDVAFYEGDGVSLEDVLREQIVLALPIKLVCKEDCQGLCPVCGENWNLRECECERKPVDVRWTALKELNSSHTE
jgi:uncharacterized protein